MPRPVEKYSLGMHHLAQPTMDPEATLEFYVETMGATITHCISSKGWRPNHKDYIHMFLDLGKGHGDGPSQYPDNIAMFYYFGAKDPSEWPKYGTHHSFAVASLDELNAWGEWLEERGHKVVWQAEYEIMTSLYVWDPNGRFLEIAYQHRPVGEIDADDARLTAQALVLASKEQACSIYRMWEHKARLIEERDGEIAPATLIAPRVEEFTPFVEAAVATGAQARERGSFTLIESEGSIKLERPSSVAEAVWWGAGTGGVKGTITMDEHTLVVEPG